MVVLLVFAEEAFQAGDELIRGAETSHLIDVVLQGNVSVGLHLTRLVGVDPKEGLVFEVDDEGVGDEKRGGVRGVKGEFFPEVGAGFGAVVGVGVVVTGDLLVGG